MDGMDEVDGVETGRATTHLLARPSPSRHTPSACKPPCRGGPPRPPTSREARRPRSGRALRTATSGFFVHAVGIVRSSAAFGARDGEPASLPAAYAAG